MVYLFIKPFVLRVNFCSFFAQASLWNLGMEKNIPRLISYHSYLWWHHVASDKDSFPPFKRLSISFSLFLSQTEICNLDFLVFFWFIVFVYARRGRFQFNVVFSLSFQWAMAKDIPTPTQIRQIRMVTKTKSGDLSFFNYLRNATWFTTTSCCFIKSSLDVFQSRNELLFWSHAADENQNLRFFFQENPMQYIVVVN